MKKKVHFGADVFNDIYSGSASLGRDYAKIVSIFSFVVAAVLIALGIYFMGKKSVYSLKVNYTVTKITPFVKQQTGHDNNQINITAYNLEGTVTECGNNKVKLEYSKKTNVGDILQVFIEPKCETNTAYENSDNNFMLGLIIILIAIGIIVFTLIKLFFVNKYKGVAAVQGVAGAKNIFERLF